jgi:hypothetical protein
MSIISSFICIIIIGFSVELNSGERIGEASGDRAPFVFGRMDPGPPPRVQTDKFSLAYVKIGLCTRDEKDGATDESFPTPISALAIVASSVSNAARGFGDGSGFALLSIKNDNSPQNL